MGTKTVVAVVVATLAVGVGALTLQATNTMTCVAIDHGALPDSGCTPGALNPAVTQATIASTICTSGYTSTIRPSEQATEPEKFKSMRQYGIPTSAGHAGKYEYDHLISLEIGGAPNDTANLWPEPHSAVVAHHQLGSFTKDRLENKLNSLVCKGTLTLAAAQTAITTDWPNAYLQYVGKLPR